MTQTKQKQSMFDLIRPYPGKWIALTQKQDMVVSVASTVKTVLARAHKKGETFPFLIKAPDSSISVFIY